MSYIPVYKELNDQKQTRMIIYAMIIVYTHIKVAPLKLLSETSDGIFFQNFYDFLCEFHLWFVPVLVSDIMASSAVVLHAQSRLVTTITAFHPDKK